MMSDAEFNERIRTYKKGGKSAAFFEVEAMSGIEDANKYWERLDALNNPSMYIKDIDSMKNSEMYWKKQQEEAIIRERKARELAKMTSNSQDFISVGPEGDKHPIPVNWLK